MQLILTTTDKVQLVSSAAANLDVVCTTTQASTASPPVPDPPGNHVANIQTAATTDIIPVASGSKVRAVKSIFVRNKHATQPCDVTIVMDVSATDYELFKCTLNPNDILEFIEGIGFFTIVAVTALDKKLYVASDVINATTSFADITGLTCPVEAGKKYAFEAMLFHIENASTTGARFGVNGPAMTSLRLGQMGVFAGSITAATMQSQVADVTALDTAIVVATSSAGTPQVVPCWIMGGFEPSANGTFAMRQQSEIAVAAGITTKRGSWCRIWECI